MMRIIRAACDVVRSCSDDEDHTLLAPLRALAHTIPPFARYRLSSLIAKPRESSRTYIGCFQRGIVITNPKKKW
ncbi:unnamed protein product [Closterium sp. NIES-65]|nr:unnamed protein product [Closterium sp. NIES-65]